VEKLIVMLFAISSTLSFVTLGAECPLENSVYEDVDGEGFRLEFTPASSESARALYAVVIKHPKRGIIFDFDFMYSLGYGEALLTPRERAGDEFHRIHFFNKDLKTRRGPEVATPYAFVEGLGYADHYAHRMEPSVGTPLWRFLRCQPPPTKEGTTPRSKLDLSAKSAVFEGGYGFDWLNPEGTRCVKMTSSFAKTCTICTREESCSFDGKDASCYKCVVNRGKSEYMIYENEVVCIEQYETMMANAP
jgi:hypothetical protein